MRHATPRHIVAAALAAALTASFVDPGAAFHAHDRLKVVAAALQAGPPARAADLEPGTLRLYIFDCGTLRDRDGVPYGLSLEQVPPRDLSNVCALVVHPRGTLLWETGLHESVNGTPPSADPRPGRPRAGDRIGRTLRSQLERVGYPPARITFLALSHAHWDHTGNLRDFLGSTWLVPRAERDSIFGRTPLPNQQDFAGLDGARAVVLDGDHDVFGDGSVRLLHTPGHTAGHQTLFVRLPQTGGVILSGDLYHFAEELALPPGDGRNAAQSAASKARITMLAAETGAQLWIQHDARHFATLRKAPEYYQ